MFELMMVSPNVRQVPTFTLKLFNQLARIAKLFPAGAGPFAICHILLEIHSMPEPPEKSGDGARWLLNNLKGISWLFRL